MLRGLSVPIDSRARDKTVHKWPGAQGRGQVPTNATSDSVPGMCPLRAGSKQMPGLCFWAPVYIPEQKHNSKAGRAGLEAGALLQGEVTRLLQRRGSKKSWAGGLQGAPGKHSASSATGLGPLCHPRALHCPVVLQSSTCPSTTP